MANFKYQSVGSLSDVLESAFTEAKKTGNIQGFKFEGIYLEVRPDSARQDIGLIFQLKKQIEQLKHG